MTLIVIPPYFAEQSLCLDLIFLGPSRFCRNRPACGTSEPARAHDQLAEAALLVSLHQFLDGKVVTILFYDEEFLPRRLHRL